MWHTYPIASSHFCKKKNTKELLVAESVLASKQTLITITKCPIIVSEWCGSGIVSG